MNRRRIVELARGWNALLPRVVVPLWLRVIGALLAAVTGRRWAYRIALLADDRLPRIAASHVLADLRGFCFATADGRRPLFDKDPVVMARRLGRRETFDWIIHYLDLDEAQVQKLLEIDDGI